MFGLVSPWVRPWGWQYQQAEEGCLREQAVVLAALVESSQALCCREACPAAQRLVLVPP